jgi:hypothetical protein
MMIDRELYHVEVAGRIAAIYVVGPLSHEGAEQLAREMDAVPATVETLCINVPDLELLGDNASALVRRLRAHWRSTRHGPFRLTFSQRDESVTDAPPTQLQSWSQPLT